MIEDLLLFKPLVGELQCPAVLGDGPNHVIRRAVWNLSLNLQGHFHIGAHQADKVRDHFIGDSPSIATYAGWVKTDASMKTFWRA